MNKQAKIRRRIRRAHAGFHGSVRDRLRIKHNAPGQREGHSPSGPPKPHLNFAVVPCLKRKREIEAAKTPQEKFALWQK